MVLDYGLLNPAALVVPAFFIFAGLEYIAARRKKQSSIFKFRQLRGQYEHRLGRAAIEPVPGRQLLQHFSIPL
jgi:hypothetical protein